LGFPESFFFPATILAAAGVDHPDTFEGKPVAPIEGKNLMPVLNNQSASVRGPDEWTGWELFGNRAIRQGDWKLLWMCKPFGASDWQLFNLRTDPGETRDVAAEHKDIRDAMVKHWEEYVKDNYVILPDVSPLCGKDYVKG
jgi:arylsulfatase